MKLHLTIPAYQESARLPGYLEKLLPALTLTGWDIRVEVVDDGSPDASSLQRSLASLRVQWPILREIRFLPENQGKGAAIRMSWDAAGPVDYVGFVDADGSIPAEEVIRLIGLISMPSSPRAVLSSRIRMLGRRVKRQWQRHYSGRIYATLVGLWINPEVYDSQCGCKFVPEAAWGRISPWMKERGFAFDVELIAALRAANVPMVEEPIDWTDMAGSKVSLLRDSVRMFTALRRIRARCRAWGVSVD